MSSWYAIDMDAIEQLKKDLREGRVDVDRLIDAMVTQQRILESTQRQLQSALRRIEELEKNAGGPTSPTTAKVDQAFSLRAEEKRQQSRRKNKKLKLSKKGRRGRLNSSDKVKLAERTEPCFPEGIPRRIVIGRIPGRCGVWKRAGPS
jgi:transposase